LNIQAYLGQEIFIPLLPEQQSIANYLDKKCDLIDRMISNLQKKIELLKELKSSVISQAVTKGLDPHAKMKDSGIEWIGEIPEHWEIMKTGLAFRTISSGITPLSSKKEYYTEKGVCWLQTGDLNDGFIDHTAKQITQKAIEDYNMKIFPSGSVVIAMYGATICKVGLLHIDTATNQACCVLSDSKLMTSEFTYELYLAAKKFLIAKAVGGGQPNISQDIIKRFLIPVPPLPEQQSIANYLDDQCKKIDGAVARAQRKIDLLKEYKTALISEVVTGKRKVSA
jgi:type I restriction enzyme S subunit